jgi:hopene-associated glycosyltransferase HpnB
MSAGIWTYLACFRGGFWRLQQKLRAGSAAATESVTAVIPARDEAELIGDAVRSLRLQVFEGLFRIIVANDESTDATADVAMQSVADMVISVPPRPSGWKGKLWTVAQGVGAEPGEPDYFLLTDADIEYDSPDVLRTLVAKAREGYDLVSVMVRLRCESSAEKLLIPAFVFFFFKLYPPRWVSLKPDVAAAAGGCMLIRRDMLERIGGIDSICSALIDDCALAKRVKSTGGRVWLGISDLPIRSMRAYGSAAEIRAMIARSAFAQLNHSTLLLIGTAAGMAITYLTPPLLVLFGRGMARDLGAFAWLLSAFIFFPSVRAYRAPLWTIFALPGIAAFYLVATVESALRYWSGRGGEWKGRVQDSLRSQSRE